MSDTQYLNKPLPSNNEAEKAILGSILLNNDLIDEALKSETKPGQFYSPFHNRVFNAMLIIRDRGDVIEPIAIGEELKKEGRLDSYGGVAAIANLTYGLPHFNNINQYLKLVREKWLARQLIKKCYEIASETLAEEEPLSEQLERAEKRIFAISNRLYQGSTEKRKGFYDLDELAPMMRERFINFHKGIGTALPTGITPYDAMLDGGGLNKKGLYIFAGKAKAGKTALVLGILYYIAKHFGVRVLSASLEMDKIQQAQRVFSQHAKIPYGFFRKGFHGEPYEIALKRLKDFSKLPISISDSLFTIGDIRTHFRRKVEQGLKPGQTPVGVGLLDYMQLVELDEVRHKGPEDRVAAVSKVSRECKHMANELDIPIIAISSMNRLGFDSTDGEPDPDNLMQSSQLAYDAEAITFVHNPNLVRGQKYIPKEVEDINMILSRQRNGPTGTVPMKMIGKMMQFMTPEEFNRLINGSQTDEIAQTKSVEDIPF